MMTQLVRRFERNPIGRDLIVGDIHGCFSKLLQALDAIGFDPARDRLFSVGDLVDRGPESDLVLDWLAKPWFHPVAGNHETAAILFAGGAMSVGLYVSGYGGAWNVGNPPAARLEYADAFGALPIAIELETALGLVGIVHADCPGPSWQRFVESLEDGALSAAALIYLITCAQESRERADRLFSGDVEGVRAVVVGHTPVEQPTSLGNVVFIDTMGWRDRAFTVLDAATLRPACMPSNLSREGA